MTVDSAERHILATLHDVLPDIGGDRLTPRDSFTRDLGLDSIALTQFFAQIKQISPEVELAPWFAEASSRRVDTAHNLALYIADDEFPLVA